MLKRITEKRLYNITLAYLSRFDASAGKVRAMLTRRLMKARLAEEEIPPDAPRWIENVILKMQSLGYIDDARYAENQIRILSRQGKSGRFIAQKLSRDGIDADMLQTLTETNETTDLDRARRFVLRKKMGPYRSPDMRADYRRKDLAALARAGFSYDVACRALETEPDDTSPDTW